MSEPRNPIHTAAHTTSPTVMIPTVTSINVKTCLHLYWSRAHTCTGCSQHPDLKFPQSSSSSSSYKTRLRIVCIYLQSITLPPNQPPPSPSSLRARAPVFYSINPPHPTSTSATVPPSPVSRPQPRIHSVLSNTQPTLPRWRRRFVVVVVAACYGLGRAENSPPSCPCRADPTGSHPLLPGL